jgi:hypothetical protein
MTYDYFVAGRTRNKAAVQTVSEKLQAASYQVYCFLDNEYVSEAFSFEKSSDPEAAMQRFEAVEDWRNNETFQKIFKEDMDALKASEKFVIVFPAGLSAHMEVGAAYGLGKQCYSIGEFEKPESLYLMLDGCYSSVEEFVENMK